MSKVRFEMINKDTGEVWFSGESVTRQNPCPICGHPTTTRREGYCVIDRNRDLVWCGHSISYGRRSFYTISSMGKAVVAPAQHLTVKETSEPKDFLEHQQRFYRFGQTNIGFMAREAQALGLHVEHLARLGAGVDEKYPDCLTFPMFDGYRNVIGIRYRASNGRKWAAVGSKNGLFLDMHEPISDGTVLCPEGPTNTAALLALKFSVVGRPAAFLGGNYLCPQADSKVKSNLDLVLFADNDKAGMDGAEKVAGYVKDWWRSVTIATPPAKYKDVRDWYRAGAKRDDVRMAVANARPV